MTKRSVIFGLVVGLLGLALAIGAQSFARPCVHADGSAAMCGPVKTWLTVEGGLIAVMAGLAILKPWPLFHAAAALGGLLAALTPGILVPICKSDTMRCQMVTRPTALVLGVLIILTAGCWFVLTVFSRKREDRP